MKKIIIWLESRVETTATPLSCLTAGMLKERGGEQQPKSKSQDTQEVGSVIQYRPNHSSLPKSRLDGEPTLWGENNMLEPKPKGTGGEKSETLRQASLDSPQ